MNEERNKERKKIEYNKVPNKLDKSALINNSNVSSDTCHYDTPHANPHLIPDSPRYIFLPFIQNYLFIEEFCPFNTFVFLLPDGSLPPGKLMSELCHSGSSLVIFCHLFQ